MITYKRDLWSHNYTLDGACGVIYEGDIHFFGGKYLKNDYRKQHFVIETKRNGRMVEMMKEKDLAVEVLQPSCSSFKITSQYFPWFSKNIVILCFDAVDQSSCYSFDGKISYIGNSTFEHYRSGLIKYKQSLLTVGGTKNQKTEILERKNNGTYIWSTVGQRSAILYREFKIGTLQLQNRK